VSIGRVVVAWAVGVAVATLGCGSSSEAPARSYGTGGTSGTSGTGGTGDTGGTTTCAPGASCFCGQVSGVTTCETGVQSCECNCPPLETHDAATVDACGGEPFGLWRLVELDLGKSELVVTLGTTEVGRCDTTFERKGGDVPLVLIDLETGGSTRQHVAGFSLTQAWSNGCVVEKADALYCSDDVWMNVSGCSVDCDICRCDSQVSGWSGDGDWLRTETTLTLTFWGDSTTYDYCISGNRMTLSAPGIFLSFERTYTFGVPVLCSERTSEECPVGAGCVPGACEGGLDCPRQTSEGGCLTIQGCTWNSSACSGTAPPACELGDYGVVPGCDFIDRPVRCTGTVPECDGRPSETCLDGDGCEADDRNICSGGTFDCEEFIACPVGDCTFTSESTCIGSSSCEQVTNRPDCDALNDNLVAPRCTWGPSFSCSGTAKQCPSYTPEACQAVPGCVLEPDP
jgi:hypothetical protein